MIKVLFVIGKNYKDFDREFGGTTKGFYSVINAFKGNKEITLTPCTDFNLDNIDYYKKKYDIYVENEASYKSIVDSFGNIYKEVYKNKNA